MGVMDMRVLVVEDNLDIGQLYRRLLNGHTVTSVTDGLRANQVLETEEFDLIILDMHIGEVSGLEVLQNARSIPTHQETPIVVISADDSLRLDASHIGIDLWMTKPIDIDCLHEYVGTLPKTH
jgi:DNA-binding response OmpR family regulator